MPRRGRGPCLCWRHERRKGGNVIARATWIIIDGSKHIATGCFAGENSKAQECLARYITEKYSPVRRERLIETIDVADVLNVYYDDTRARQANQSKLDERILRLASWWGGKTLADVNGESCRGLTRRGVAAMVERDAISKTSGLRLTTMKRKAIIAAEFAWFCRRKGFPVSGGSHDQKPHCLYGPVGVIERRKPSMSAVSRVRRLKPISGRCGTLRDSF